MLHILEKSREFTDEYFDNDSKIRIGKNTKIEPGVIIYDGCVIGENCLIGTSAVLKPNTTMGDHSVFGTLSATEGDVVIGDWTTVSTQIHITSGTKIGDNVFIGPMVYSTNTPKISLGKFGRPNSTHDPRKNIVIEDGVRIGGGVGLAPGVRIGENSLIDMGCLITKDIPPNSHVRGGNDLVGKVIGKIK